MAGAGRDAAQPGAGGGCRGRGPTLLLALACDALVEEVHFPASTPAAAVGFKSLAVNVSDLAAMGALPGSATCVISGPGTTRRGWVARCRAGLRDGAAAFGVSLEQVRTHSTAPRTSWLVAVDLRGEVEAGRALTRDGARPGDLLYVSGTLGDAAAWLTLWRRAGGPPGAALHRRGRAPRPGAALRWLRGRLERPSPRVRLGRALRGVASACIDVSDGLLADLAHIAERSGVGADVEAERIPLSGAARSLLDLGEARECALTGGDDYELLFTAPPDRARDVAAAARAAGVPVTRIGTVGEERGLRLWLPGRDEPERVPSGGGGYRHF